MKIKIPKHLLIYLINRLSKIDLQVYENGSFNTQRIIVIEFLLTNKYKLLEKLDKSNGIIALKLSYSTVSAIFNELKIEYPNDNIEFIREILHIIDKELKNRIINKRLVLTA